MAAEFIEGPVPDLEPEYGKLIEADDLLELSKLTYYNACFDFAEKPSRRSHKVLEQATEKLANAFEQELEALQEDSTSYQFMVAACNAVTVHGKNRVDALNAFMEGTEFGHTVSEIPEEADWAVEADQEEEMKTIIKNSALDVFVQTLTTDTNAFLDYVNESKPGKRAHFRDDVIAHSMDVGKIALGTAIGVAVARLISRKA